MHVKDALPNGTVVAAGEGATNWPALLRHLHADGYDGFFSLEPHLATAGQFQGFSGPELFHKASQALQGMLREMEWRMRNDMGDWHIASSCLGAINRVHWPIL